MFLWLNFIIVVFLLISVSAKYISPLLFWLPAFFGLAFPFLFFINLLFIFYWLFQFKPAVIISISTLLLCLPTTFNYIQFNTSNKLKQSNEIKITSYNCMLFDLYQWKKSKGNRIKILNNLAEINPDILCLQEFFTSEENNNFNNITDVKKILKIDYHHTEYTATRKSKKHWGIATFSKYPILNEGKMIFDTKNNNLCIYSDILINNDTIRVYNIHLQSIGFSKTDNKFIDDIASENISNDVENSKNIIKRLKIAFIKRAQQVDMIVAHLKTCKYKIILCGDFNDTGASYSYENLSKSLKDSFIEKGNGLGQTYAGNWPQFRIDYILHSPLFTCLNYKRSPITFTDHYPITAVLKLPDNK